MIIIKNSIGKQLTEQEYESLMNSCSWKPIFLEETVSNYIIGTNGKVISNFNGKHTLLKENKTKGGYVLYCLYHNHRKYWRYAHRLVATEFIPIPEHLKNCSIDDLEVNHKKGDYENKSNNDVSNLEWTTSSENKIHAYRNGLKKEGEDHPDARYTNDQIYGLCLLLERNVLSRMEISRITKVDDTTVGTILSGKQWKSISKDFDFSNRKKKHTLYEKSVIDAAIDMLRNNDREKLSFSEIGRRVGMSRSSVHYLYQKYFKH